MALVIAQNAVAGVGEPDRVVSGHHDVVRRIELLAVEAVEDGRDSAVVLGARDTPGVMLAAEQPPLPVPGIAVRIVRRLAEHTHVTVFLVPAHHSIVGNVAPDQAAIVPDIDRPFGPAEPGGDALDGGIADLVLEAWVERLHAG